MTEEPSSRVAIRMTIVNPVDEGDSFNEPQEFMFEDEDTNSIYVGRSPGNAIVLPNVAVSGNHIQIVRRENEFLMLDLGSRNGSHLNDQRLEANEQKFLRDGDRIRVVNYVIQVHCGLSAYQPQNEENTRQLAFDMLKNVLGGASHYEEKPPKIMVMSGDQQGIGIELAEICMEILIGRSPHCELCILDENISREHALIKRDWTGVSIRDLESRNGILINEKKLRPSAERRLHDRDEIVLGTIKLSFSDPEGAHFESELGQVVQNVGLVAGENEERQPIPKPTTPPPVQENLSQGEQPEEKNDENDVSEDDENDSTPGKDTTALPQYGLSFGQKALVVSVLFFVLFLIAFVVYLIVFG